MSYMWIEISIGRIALAPYSRALVSLYVTEIESLKKNSTFNLNPQIRKR